MRAATCSGVSSGFGFAPAQAVAAASASTTTVSLSVVIVVPRSSTGLAWSRDDDLRSPAAEVDLRHAAVCEQAHVRPDGVATRKHAPERPPGDAGPAPRPGDDATVAPLRDRQKARRTPGRRR